MSDLTRVLLAAGTAAAAAGGVTGDFKTILENTKIDAPASGDSSSAVEPPAKRGSKAAAGASKTGKKSKAGGKGKGGAADKAAESEPDEAAAARRKVEEREAGVRAWAEELRAALERETFLTTSHRAAVAARDAIILEVADRTKVRVREHNMAVFKHR